MPTLNVIKYVNLVRLRYKHNYPSKNPPQATQTYLLFLKHALSIYNIFFSVGGHYCFNLLICEDLMLGLLKIQ